MIAPLLRLAAAGFLAALAPLLAGCQIGRSEGVYGKAAMPPPPGMAREVAAASAASQARPAPTPARPAP